MVFVAIMSMMARRAACLSADVPIAESNSTAARNTTSASDRLRSADKSSNGRIWIKKTHEKLCRLQHKQSVALSRITDKSTLCPTHLQSVAQSTHRRVLQTYPGERKLSLPLAGALRSLFACTEHLGTPRCLRAAITSTSFRHPPRKTHTQSK